MNMSSQRNLRSSITRNIPGVPGSRVGRSANKKRASNARSSSPAVKSPEPKKRNVGESKVSTPSERVRVGAPEQRTRPEDDASDNVFIDRPAEPHRTNAPLVTPRGSRYVTYSEDHLNGASKASLPSPTTTTGHILQQACSHLIQMDPSLQPLIERRYCRVFCPEGLAEECDPFKSLCSGIMAQQVSGAAASSIKRKFVSLFPKSVAEPAKEPPSFPTPAQVAACSVPFLRQAGLSERKAEYIKGLAEKFDSGELGAAMLLNASDEEVLEKLTAVRGLGKWSVEMFACFGLKRMDIFSTGDLGVQVRLPEY